jgi:hypothetical protein
MSETPTEPIVNSDEQQLINALDVFKSIGLDVQARALLGCLQGPEKIPAAYTRNAIEEMLLPSSNVSLETVISIAMHANHIDFLIELSQGKAFTGTIVRGLHEKGHPLQAIQVLEESGTDQDLPRLAALYEEVENEEKAKDTYRKMAQLEENKGMYKYAMVDYLKADKMEDAIRNMNAELKSEKRNHSHEPLPFTEKIHRLFQPHTYGNDMFVVLHYEITKEMLTPLCEVLIQQLIDEGKITWDIYMKFSALGYPIRVLKVHILANSERYLSEATEDPNARDNRNDRVLELAKVAEESEEYDLALTFLQQSTYQEAIFRVAQKAGNRKIAVETYKKLKEVNYKTSVLVKMNRELGLEPDKDMFSAYVKELLKQGKIKEAHHYATLAGLNEYAESIETIELNTPSQAS